MRLQNTERVHDAKGCDHGEEGPQDDGPGLTTAIGVCSGWSVIVVDGGDGGAGGDGFVSLWDLGGFAGVCRGRAGIVGDGGV